MQIKAGTYIAIGAIAFSTGVSAQTIAYGQQLQNNDQTNHWVAWIDGQSACPSDQILSVLTDSPCNIAFNLGEVEYTFTGCSGPGAPPSAILDSGGLQVGACGDNDSDKITCHGDTHDIIKHGTCTVVTSE